MGILAERQRLGQYVDLLLELIDLAFEHEEAAFVEATRLVVLFVDQILEHVVLFFEQFVTGYHVLDIFYQVATTGISGFCVGSIGIGDGGGFFGKAVRRG